MQIVPTERPEAAVVVEGNLTVTPFTEMRAELVPPVVKGRFRGRPVLAVDNLGNVKLTASVTGVESSDQLGFDIHPSNVQIEPGRAAFVRSTVRPQAVTWFGRKETRPFQLAVQRSGTEPLPVDGTYVQRSVLPHWILATFSILLALAIVFVILWFTRAPTVQSLATEKAANPSAEALEPSASPEKSEPAASSEPPEAEKEKPSGEKNGGGQGAPKKPAAPPLPLRKGEPPVLIRNVATDMCADVPDYGTGDANGFVGRFHCDATSKDNQLWTFHVLPEYKAPGGAVVFDVRNLKGGLCMDLPARGAERPGSPAEQSNCAGNTTDNGLWWLDQQGEGRYWIRSFSSNDLCLEAAGTEQPLRVADCRARDDVQVWFFQPAAPESG
ncbi:RICIN domain-containing protein [Streptomyces sp. Ru87]|uniref:RICIN domain-containing protein n=1 Tax=Streptomyces sp. Ru87 TaxID=2044307 RepID=UPI00211D759A|nr:RICIN domain-containing protein [Streptomyces sp. Ru87]